MQDKSCVLEALAALTDIRPPPLRDMATHFGDPELLSELVAGLGGGQPDGARMLACMCCRNLGRVSKIRGMLERAIGPLVETLSDTGGELVGPAAAALCNVACTPAGKDQAVAEGAVPKLLAAIRTEEKPQAADDMVACIGVLTSGFSRGAEAVLASEEGVAPLLEALRTRHPALSSTILEVLGDLARALGTSGQLAPALAADAKLATEDLPHLVASPEAEVRGGALKLVALLCKYTASEADSSAAADIRRCRQRRTLSPRHFQHPHLRQSSGNGRLLLESYSSAILAVPIAVASVRHRA